MASLETLARVSMTRSSVLPCTTFVVSCDTGAPTPKGTTSSEGNATNMLYNNHGKTAAVVSQDGPSLRPEPPNQQPEDADDGHFARIFLGLDKTPRKPQGKEEDVQSFSNHRQELGLSMLVQPPVAAPGVVPSPLKKVKRRSQEPQHKSYVEEPTRRDVMFGRGTRSNIHEGNQWYRQAIAVRQPAYKRATMAEKTRLSQSVVDEVHRTGGRFLKQDASGRWYVVTDIVARTKASQALREDNTAEKRAEKRMKYRRNKTSPEVTA